MTAGPIEGATLIAWAFKPGKRFKTFVAEAPGFAPHGAGRDASRTQHLRTALGGALAAELAELGVRGLEIRSFCGRPDLSELPSAYKGRRGP